MIGLGISTVLLNTQVFRTTPLKPIVIAINVPATSVDRMIVETRVAEDRASYLKERGYELHELPDFILATPNDLLGTKEANDQIALFRAIAAKARSGGHTVAARDLPPSEARELRRTLGNAEGDEVRAAVASPDLKLRFGTMTVFRMQSGGQTMDVRVYPRGLPPKEDDSVMTSPWKGRSLPDTKALTDLRNTSAKKPRGALTFLTPTNLDGVRGLEWVAEAQAELLKEAKDARASWKKESDALLDALAPDTDANYAQKPDERSPQFSDLNPDVRQSAATLFEAQHPGALGGMSGPDWMRGATTLNASTVPVFQIQIDRGEGVTSVATIPVVCPIGP